MNSPAKKRNAVEIRLLGSFTLMLLLMIGACMVAFFVFATIIHDFDTGVAPSMETVAESVSLAEQSHRLNRFAPHLILARNQHDLLNETLAFLEACTAFRKALSDSSLSQTHGHYLAEMGASVGQVETFIRELDLLVAQRIDAETETRRIVPNFLRMVDQTYAVLLQRYPQRRRPLKQWRDAMLEVSGLLLSVQVEPNPSLLKQRRERVSSLLRGTAAPLYPRHERSRHFADHQRLTAMILGPSGYFVQVRRIALMEASARKVLQQERVIAAKLSTTTKNLVTEARDEVYRIRYQTSQFLSQMRWLMSGALLLAVLATILVVVYVERSVIRRIFMLRENMTHYGAEKVPLQALGGEDELSDMYQALKELIQRVEDREAQLEELATTDALTGIANRRCFSERVEAELGRARRNGRPLGLLLLDIDFFKKINDNYGHDVGDKVLIELTRRVGAQLRSIDLFARLGGEEFSILLPETSLPGALLVAERMRKNMAAEPMVCGEHKLLVTMSVGVTCFEAEDSLDRALKRADQALYAAKEGGRNRVEVAPTGSKSAESNGSSG